MEARLQLVTCQILMYVCQNKEGVFDDEVCLMTIIAGVFYADVASFLSASGTART